MWHLFHEHWLGVDDAIASQWGVKNSWCYFTSVLNTNDCENNWGGEEHYVFLELAKIWMRDWKSFTSDNVKLSLKKIFITETFSYFLRIILISKVLNFQFYCESNHLRKEYDCKVLSVELRAISQFYPYYFSEMYVEKEIGMRWQFLLGIENCSRCHEVKWI